MITPNYTIQPSLRLSHAHAGCRVLVFIFILLINSFASADIPKSIGSILSKYSIPLESVSALAIELGSNAQLTAHLADTPRNPASVMKLVTTYAALGVLGPAHQWETHYYLNGTLSDGTLTGDLVIKGGGDPYLVKEQFWLHLAALRELGLKKITGNLLIDNTAFELEPFDPAAFDKQPTRLYNVGPAATLVNFNATRFRIQPDSGRAKILLDPPMHNISVNNQLKLVKGKCRGAKSGWSMHAATNKNRANIVLKGNYRAQCGTYDLRRSVLSSDAYLYGLFTHLWQGLGGEFGGGYQNAEVASSAKPIYTGTAKTLVEVIKGANKFSNNLLARQLLLSIAHHYFGDGATVTDGTLSIQTWLKDNGLIFPELVMENGAGLSRQILISARSLGDLLLHANKSVYRPEFLSSFSLGGVDGTMKKRMIKQNLGGRARIKTGYIKGARTLAGYLRADSGKDYAVVFLIENPKVNFSNGNQIQDAFIKWVLKNG